MEYGFRTFQNFSLDTAKIMPITGPLLVQFILLEKLYLHEKCSTIQYK